MRTGTNLRLGLLSRATLALLLTGLASPAGHAADVDWNVAPISLAAGQAGTHLAGEDVDAEASSDSPPGPAAVRAEAVTGPPDPPAEAPATQPAEDPIQAAIARIKNPVPWFRWAADYRIRNEYLRNVQRLNRDEVGNEQNWLRHRLRWGATLSLGDLLDVNTRIVWEGRNICKPDFAQNFDRGEVLFDTLNFTLRNPAGIPVVIVAGRQEIALGDRWLVFEGTPLDGSRSVYFDAIRATTTLADIQTRIDTIYIEQDAEAEHWVPMIERNNRATLTGAPVQRYVTEQDERGVILWVENKSIERTEFDGYFIYKNDRRAAPNGLNSDLYTFGTRALHELSVNWRAKGEVAGQFGRKNGQSVCALGSLDRLSYHFNDAHRNWLRLDYEYMSGDRPGTGTYEGFDPLWGRWPRYSEMLISPVGAEIRPSDLSNLHRVALGHSVNLLPQVEMISDYHLLFADENTFRDRAMFSDNGCFRGQLLTWWLRYSITPQVSGHLLAEFFFPGDYYARTHNDPAAFLRAELVFAF